MALIRKTRLVNCVFEAFTSLELRLFGSLDLDGFTGAWVTTCGGRARRDGECAEANNANFVAALQRIGNRIEYGIDGFTGVRLAEVRAIGDGCN